MNQRHEVQLLLYQNTHTFEISQNVEYLSFSVASSITTNSRFPELLSACTKPSSPNRRKESKHRMVNVVATAPSFFLWLCVSFRRRMRCQDFEARSGLAEHQLHRSSEATLPRNRAKPKSTDKLPDRSIGFYSTSELHSPSSTSSTKHHVVSRFFSQPLRYLRWASYETCNLLRLHCRLSWPGHYGGSTANEEEVGRWTKRANTVDVSELVCPEKA
jgi:hypothetical protein